MRIFLREGKAIEDQRFKREVIGARAAQHAEKDALQDFLDAI